MARKLTALAGETGSTSFVFVRFRRSDGAVWNTSGTPAFEAYNVANIANYAIAATETGATGEYTASDPAGDEGYFYLVKKAGGSLAASDLVSNVYWEGIAGPQAAIPASLHGHKKTWYASDSGSDNNDGLSPDTPKTLKGCIAVAAKGEAIFHLPMSGTAPIRLDYYWNGSVNTQSDGFGNINLSAGVSLYATPGTVTFSSFRALTPDNNSQTSRGAIIVGGNGTTIDGIEVWPRASEPGVVCVYTRSGTTATVTHAAHGFATGMTITISGSAPENIDGDYTITVTGANTYTLTTAGSSSTSGAGTFRFADYDIYQGSYGNLNSQDATATAYTFIRRCRSLGAYVSDVVYFDVSQTSPARQIVYIEDCDFISGWDCLFAANTNQFFFIKNTRMATFGQSPADATYARVIRAGNARIVLDNCILEGSGGSTTKQLINGNGAVIAVTGGTTFSATAGTDITLEGASAKLWIDAAADRSRISNAGSTVYGPVNIAQIADAAVNTNTAQIGVNVVNAAGTAWASGAITSGVFASGAITTASIAADAITDAKVAADVTIASVTGSVGSVVGAVGSVTGMVTANTIQISGDSVAADNAEAFFDGTGYAGTNNVIPTVTVVTGAVGSISGIAFPTNFGALGINVSGHVSRVVLADTLTTYTGDTPQTGDAFARIGAAGAGLTALGDTRIANLDATVSSRLSTAGYTAPDNATIATISTNVTTLLSRITSTLFSGITSLANWLRSIARTANNDATAILEINANNGTGIGTFSPTTDSQESIRDGLASAGTGSGARTVTVTVNDGSVVLSSAGVRFTKGAESYQSTTNGSGVASFNLDDGTWTVSITKSGYTFAGTTLVVDGTEIPTYSMTALNISAPVDPTQCVGYCITRDGQGAYEALVDIDFWLTEPPTGTGHSYSRARFTETSDADGLLEVTLLKSAVYKARRGKGGPEIIIQTTTADTFELPVIPSDARI